ncbi:rho GTPase-activating protein 30 isoform X2 [Elgaria multicarinata webbii]|uniref:rho GTPase-activating protein 30 isoform X2 n=1 Tax=Elgaria multicarinata webbii TaxID=159646 RepID=UPI002FCD4BAC
MSLAMKARQRARRKGAAKDRVFGCDLVEHLQLSGQDVPQVLKSCTEFVEYHGVVDGIYRLSGVSSNIQKLRQEFDTDRSPDLNKDVYLQDIHCVSSLCKAYFRELPNPLLTYQLYDKFAEAVAIPMEEGRLEKIKEVLKELPSPHYRTLEFLMKHLVHMASFSAQTNMHVRNLAIVWAPNLLRSKDIEASGFNGTAAFMEVRIQSIVVEFILTHVEQIFGDAPLRVSSRESLRKSLHLMGSPVTLPEEKYSFSYNVPAVLNQGDGPPQMRPYHTIIEFQDSKKGSIKAKKWKSIFNLGRSSNDSKRKSSKLEDKDDKAGKMRLRPAKSMDSLSSLPCSSDDHTQLGRKKSQKQLTLCRESFDGPVSLDNCFLESDEGPDKVKAEEMQGESEGEATAKSEPTTPKASRSSLVGVAPQGRSPKATRSRAEKCAGVHISGPFSVTVPFHITSNLTLSRLTQGLECPALSRCALEKEALETLAANGEGSSEQQEAEGKLTPTADTDKEEPAKEDATVEDENQMSMEVQDSFSFLDSPDAWLGDTLDDSQPWKNANMVSDFAGCGINTFPATEDDMGSGFMNEMIGGGMELEMFSTVPPLDYLSIEDCMNEHSEEEDDQYYLAMGIAEGEEPSKEVDNEEVYLSAFDDLSPLASELQHFQQPEEDQAPNFPPPDSVLEDQPFSLVGWTLAQSGTEPQLGRRLAHDLELSHLHLDPELANPPAEVIWLSRSNSNELEMQVKDGARSATPEPVLSLLQGEGADAGGGNGVLVQAGGLVQSAGPDGTPDLSCQRSPVLECENQPELEDEWQLTAQIASEAEQVEWPPCMEADGSTPEVAGTSGQDMACGLSFQEPEQLQSAEAALRPQSAEAPSSLEEVSGVELPALLGNRSEKDPFESSWKLPARSLAWDPEQAASSGADVPLPDVDSDSSSLAVSSPKSYPGSLPHKLQPAPPVGAEDALKSDPSDGSVHMKLTSSTIRVQQVKSFPVVPPKPQFAKVPPSLTPRTPTKESSAVWPNPPPAKNGGSEVKGGSLHRALRPTSLDTYCSAAGLEKRPEALLPPSEAPTPSANHGGDSEALPKQRSSMPVCLERYGRDGESGGDVAPKPLRSPPEKCSFWARGGEPNSDDLHLAKSSLPERSSDERSGHTKSQENASGPSPRPASVPALTEKPAGVEACEASPQKQRWATWRNGGSMSFDEAVALAKERHVAQAPMRRMQTYCYGDAEGPHGPGRAEKHPPQPKPALKPLGQRPLRPLSCLGTATPPEALASGKPLLTQALVDAGPEGPPPPSWDAHSFPPDLPARRRLSLPRIGRCPSLSEEASHALPQERR